MIPKIIHYCWFGQNEMSELGKMCLESWKKYCPDYEIRLWNEDNIDISSVNYMQEAYEAKAWGFVPDVARLQIIYECGGIYLDTDVEVIKPLDELLNNNAFAGQEDNCCVALGLGFGAEKGNPIIKKLLDDYSERHFKLKDGTYDRTPAPNIQAPTFVELGYKEGNNVQQLGTISVYPSEYFCPKSYVTGQTTITENTFSIHHYEGTWCSEEEKEITEHRWETYRRFGRAGRVACMFRNYIDCVKDNGFIYSVRWAASKLRRYLVK